MPEITIIIFLFIITLGPRSFLFGIWMDMNRNQVLYWKNSKTGTISREIIRKPPGQTE
ncbi:MAG: hypothetical protein LBR53_01355 [Deltaproteobacteria bacterium]|jgi:hypothetical protein|nr:hypothetical protein [Deltaproteobacteria bacterium]